MRRRLPIDYAIRNLTRRPGRTLLTGLAGALVTAVIVMSVSFGRALERSFTGPGRGDTSILLSSSAMRDVIRSAITPAVADLVAADVPGVLTVHDVPAVSPEIHMATKLRLGGAEDTSSVVHAAFVRGITERAFLVHEKVTLIEGRLPRSGEVLVGRLVAPKLGVSAVRLAPGAILRFEGATWTVSGVFGASGTTIESEIWAPLRELQGVARRDDISAVFVRMKDPSGLDDIDVFAQRRLDLELTNIPAAVYYRELAGYFAPLRSLAWGMTILIALAALVTGANALNTTVQDRLGELATLRALGYPGSALAASLSLEALLLAAAGGLAGLAIASPLVSQATFRIGMGAFRLDADGPAVLAGLVGVLVLGAFGSIPAVARVLRLPIATALKED